MMARTPADKGRPGPVAGDALLWKRVAEQVTPLKRRKPAPVLPPAAAAPAMREPEPGQAWRRPAGPVPRPVGPPPELRPDRAPGLDKSTHDRLRRGQLPIDGKLDLHGMDREKAHRALDRFLGHAAAQGRRCVLVVTGKGRTGPGENSFGQGGGVLKGEVPRWLNEQPNRARLLAFCPAQPRHGGGGALYVYLKRRRDE